MPVTSTPDHQLRIVFTVCSGTVSLEDIENYQHTVWLDPEIYGYNELFDLDDADFSQLDFSDLITIAQTASKLYTLDPNSRFAFLTKTSRHDELAGFYITAKSMTPGPTRELEKFTSREKALNWLQQT